MTQTLTAGQSTIADAAAAYGVPVARIVRELHECLTDVYTAEGDAGVISTPGRAYATVTGAAGEQRVPAAALTLGRDSIAVLAEYIR